jgi:competence protein ComEC
VPGAAELFNHAAWFFMWLMVRFSEWAAQVPGGCFHVAGPSPAVFALYYALMIGVLGGWLFRPRLRLWTGCVLVILAAWCFIDWQAGRAHSRLTVVPLNGGEVIYFKAAHSSRDFLVDCGNESAAEFTLKPFLRGQGVNRLSELLLTHGDINSVGGARLIAGRFPPQKVWFSQVSFRSAVYRDAVDYFGEKPGLVQTIGRGDRLGFWTALHPEENDRFTQADDNTVVLDGQIEGVRLLLLSDLGRSGQNALMNRSSGLRADIVISGLPQQSDPMADALLDALQPQLIVIADSEYPSSQRAPPKLRERLAARQMPVLYTSEVGAITLVLSEGRWIVRPMTGNELSGSAR